MFGVRGWGSGFMIQKNRWTVKHNMTAGAGIYREAALMNPDDDIYKPARLGGDGWWDDAVSEAKRGLRVRRCAARQSQVDRAASSRPRRPR